MIRLRVGLLMSFELDGQMHYPGDELAVNDVVAARLMEACLAWPADGTVPDGLLSAASAEPDQRPTG
ncbi:hypothetical protein ACWGBH_03480 [Streptomyces massasporeus]